MRPAALIATIFPLLLSAADSVTVPLHGNPQVLAKLPAATGTAVATVIFLPGDGGWRGAAITMARTISSWGYDVYGFDTKKYLETHSANAEKVSREEMADDMRALAARLAGTSTRHIILVGWSQGAGMAIAAVAGAKPSGLIQGIVTLGLPESAVLGWDWKATLASIAHRQPDQPSFLVKPLLVNLAPMPLWMIYGTDDEYTSAETERELFRSAGEPKHMEEVAGANHRFDGHQEELFRALKNGLGWIASR